MKNNIDQFLKDLKERGITVNKFCSMTTFTPSHITKLKQGVHTASDYTLGRLNGFIEGWDALGERLRKMMK